MYSKCVIRVRLFNVKMEQYEYSLITVARDSGRLLYFGRVIYFLFIYLVFFFRPPNFRRP